MDVAEQPRSPGAPRAHRIGRVRVPFHHADPTGSAGIVALDVAFRAECRRGDAVRSCAEPLADDRFAHALRRSDGVEIARAQCWWRAASP